jgi:hypothetical protein
VRRRGVSAAACVHGVICGRHNGLPVQQWCAPGLSQPLLAVIGQAPPAPRAVVASRAISGGGQASRQEIHPIR